jgi:hypothetical protein
MIFWTRQRRFFLIVGKREKYLIIKVLKKLGKLKGNSIITLIFREKESRRLKNF